MIQFVCDACGKVDKMVNLSTLKAAYPVSHIVGIPHEELHLCIKCAAAALKPPVLEVGKKYKARDSRGNVGEVEIAEITVMKEKRNDR